jgi:phosphoserine phosphatase
MATPKKISGTVSEVDKAIAAIKRRYPSNMVGEFKGTRSLSDAVEEYKDLVLSSPLPERFSNRALMAAATKVGTQRFVAYGAGSEDVRKMRAAGKPVATKAAKKNK